MHVGQGDGAVLISPGGQVVLFDSGVRNNCDLPLAYLQQLGVTEVDYHIASHYHDDHIGCADTVLAAYPVRGAAIDRGQTYTTATYRRYEARVRAARVAATPGMTITLDSGSTHPVVLTVAVVNGITAAGDTFPTNNENDRSALVWVRFGLFDALIGGDLSGARTSSYRDIEIPAAARMGPVEVFKVHTSRQCAQQQPGLACRDHADGGDHCRRRQQHASPSHARSHGAPPLVRAIRNSRWHPGNSRRVTPNSHRPNPNFRWPTRILNLGQSADPWLEVPMNFFQRARIALARGTAYAEG